MQKVVCFFLTSFAILAITCWNSFSATENLAENLYLIAGQPTPDCAGRHPVTLYKLQRGKVSKVADVVPAKEGTEFIRRYYDERIVIVQTQKETGSGATSSMLFYLINMDEPRATNSFKVNYPSNTSIVAAHLVDAPGKGLVQLLHLGRIDEKGKFRSKLVGTNLKTRKQEETTWEDFKHVKVSGSPGGPLPGETFLVSAGADGKVRIFAMNEKVEKIESEWMLPEGVKVQKDQDLTIDVNNDEVLALRIFNPRIKNDKNLYVFNKKNRTWNHVPVPGSGTYVTAFGTWLTATVAEDMSEPACRMVKDKQPPVDNWRAEDSGLCFSGKLYLYNAATSESYTLNTSAADSQVLFIDGNKVFYRVNDRLYKASIGDFKNASLVAKDRILKNVHWAFTSPR